MFSLTRVVRDLVVRRDRPPAPPGQGEPDLGQGLRALARVALAPIGAVPRAAAALPDLLRTLGARGRAIPPARRQAPDPVLALRALAGLMRGGDQIRGGYLALLTATMDRAVAADVHPAFLDVLAQLDGDELKLLASLDDERPHPLLTLSSRLRLGGGSRVELRHFSLLGERAGCLRIDHTPAYLDNLARLGLVEIRPTRLADDLRVFEELESHPTVARTRARIEAQPPVRIGPLSEPVVADVQYQSLLLTAFGRQFRGATAYRPETFAAPPPSGGGAAADAGSSPG
jgi:hypothetical protein